MHFHPNAFVKPLTAHFKRFCGPAGPVSACLLFCWLCLVGIGAALQFRFRKCFIASV